MKVGPKAGTKYNVASKANMENPNDVYNAGRAGTGSNNGLTINHAPIGTNERGKTGGKALGDKTAIVLIRSRVHVCQLLNL
jgi:hypothetical protein